MQFMNLPTQGLFMYWHVAVFGGGDDIAKRNVCLLYTCSNLLLLSALTLHTLPYHRRSRWHGGCDTSTRWHHHCNILWHNCAWPSYKSLLRLCIHQTLYSLFLFFLGVFTTSHLHAVWNKKWDHHYRNTLNFCTCAHAQLVQFIDLQYNIQYMCTGILLQLLVHCVYC